MDSIGVPVKPEDLANFARLLEEEALFAEAAEYAKQVQQASAKAHAERQPRTQRQTIQEQLNRVAQQRLLNTRVDEAEAGAMGLQKVGDVKWSGLKDQTLRLGLAGFGTSWNTVELTCKYTEIAGEDRVYCAMSLLRPGQDAAKDTACHCALRVARVHSPRPSASIVLTYRHEERWAKSPPKTDALTRNSGLIPSPGEEFRLRISIYRRVGFVHINDTFITAYKLHDTESPKIGERLELELPSAGDFGEKSTLEVTGVKVGRWTVPGELLQQLVHSHSWGERLTVDDRPQQPVPTDRIRIEGLSMETDSNALYTRFASYGVKEVLGVGEARGYFDIVLGSVQEAQRATADMHGQVVDGYELKVFQLAVDPKPLAAAGAAAGAGEA